MNAPLSEPWELSREECLALLRTEPFGRLIFVSGTVPTVLPVNFVVDGSGVVLRTRAGSEVCHAAEVPAVAFQADSVDRQRGSGWSVVVTGRARVADDPLEVDRLSRLPLQTWVAGDRNTYLVVELGNVTGRRIGGPERSHS